MTGSSDPRRPPRWLIFVLAALNLAFPAALLWLMRPTFLGTGSIGNWPSIVARGVMSITFLGAAILLFREWVVVGVRLTVLGLVLNLLLIGWFWSRSGVVWTIEIEGWFAVDAIVVLTLAAIRRFAKFDVEHSPRVVHTILGP